MAFLESPRFPDSIAYGAVGGPRWNTKEAFNAAGYRAALAGSAHPMREYDVAHGLKTQEQLDELLDFFQVTQGKLNGFRFKDWTDYTVASGRGSFLSLGGGTHQLRKLYTIGAGSYYRNITKPVSGTLTITGTGSYSINYATGVLTVSSGADPTAWTGQFDVPCEFRDDHMKITLEDYNGVTWGGILIRETREIS